MRALLTGVTGFIGSHVARAILDQGGEVHAVIRPGARLDRIPDLVDEVRLHTDDGAENLAGIVATAAPDLTLHLATRFLAHHGPDDVAGLVTDNVAFPARLADALANAGHRSFVNVGTAWQHVGGAAYRPRNLYAATKQALEDVLVFYADQDLLDVVTVNLYDSYGPHDHRGKLLSALVAALADGPMVEMTSGLQLIDLVHVEDVARALLLAGEHTRAGGGGQHAFAVSSGRPRTVREVVELLSAVAGRPVPVRWGARPDRAGEMHDHWAAGPPVPGWAPRIGLDAGLTQLVHAARAGSSSPSPPPPY